MKNKHRIRRLVAALVALVLLAVPLSDARAAYQADTDAYALVTGNPDIVYQVSPGESVPFDPEDFRAFFYARCQNDTFRYVTFQPDSTLKVANGLLYSDYGTEEEVAYSRTLLEQTRFYDRSSLYGFAALESLRFVANRQPEGDAVGLSFTVYGDAERSTGRLNINIGASSTTTAAPVAETAVVDLTWHVTAGEVLRFERNDFRSFFTDRASNDSFRYITFQPDASFTPENGYLYYDFEGKGQTQFGADALRATDFFYSSSRYGSYPISGLSFVAANEGGGNLVRLGFTTFGRTERYSGALVIQIDWAKSNNNTPNVATPVTPAPVTNHTLPDVSHLVEALTPDDAGDTQPTPVENQLNSPDADIIYMVHAGENVDFSLEDFTVPAGEKLKGALRYATFSTSDALSPETGFLLVSAEDGDPVTLTSDTIESYRFYVESSDYGAYPLANLSFAAPVTAPDRTIEMTCTVYDAGGETVALSMSVQVAAADPAQIAELTQPSDDGEEPPYVEPVTDNTDTPETPPVDTPPVVTPAEPDKPEPVNVTTPFTGVPVPAGNILYSTTGETVLRLVSDDFNRFFRKAFPGGTLSHVNFASLPAHGTLYYDYYSSSPYGDIHQLQLTASSLASLNFYFSPAYADRCSLAELMYVPADAQNACETVAFSATGLSAEGDVAQCTGDVLISVTKALITDVYGAIPIGRTVTFPASNIIANVNEATGAEANGIRLLDLPAASVGSVRAGEEDAPASTQDVYHWPTGAPLISDLHFVPAENYTGSVEIPYVAVDANGVALGIGHFNLGIIASLKRFNDVPSSLWCYKYVTELAAAGIVGGYSNDTYRPDISVTWGAALKLIMLAAGYDEQPGSSMSPFQGYLDKALEDRLLPREIDLWEPVTRLEVAELAAAAMKLDMTYLSSVKPFSDTDSLSVQALNAAGIINGYYNEGQSTFRPDGTLTRGQAAAIVWRMRNYEG